MPILEYYELLADGDGTTRSRDTPFGVAVRTKEEADRFVREGRVGYSNSYRKVVVYDGVAEYRKDHPSPSYSWNVAGTILVDNFETGVQFVFPEEE
jgi:hypothetical protein